MPSLMPRSGIAISPARIRPIEIAAHRYRLPMKSKLVPDGISSKGMRPLCSNRQGLDVAIARVEVVEHARDRERCEHVRHDPDRERDRKALDRPGAVLVEHQGGADRGDVRV